MNYNKALFSGVRFWNEDNKKMEYLNTDFTITVRGLSAPQARPWTKNSRATVDANKDFMMKVNSNLWDKDVIEFDINRETHVGVVTYDPSLLAWCADERGTLYPLNTIRVIKVLGNIYEAPELINNSTPPSPPTSNKQETQETKVGLNINMDANGNVDYQLSYGDKKKDCHKNKDSGQSLSRLLLVTTGEALSLLKRPCKVDITTNSKNFAEALKQAPKWRKADWLKENGQKVSDEDAWGMLLDEVEKHQVRIKYSS